MTTSRSELPPAAPAHPASAVEPKRKVMIVDDDREMREMLAMALKHQGFDVAQAANGLRLISTLHVDKPDVILMDVNMSWIDGFELCRAVRKSEEFSKIPVVFVSARSSAGDVKRGLEAGAVDYFTKPVDIQTLIGRIRELMPERAAPPSPL
jgi:DNA-binding response OmpR family regulator